MFSKISVFNRQKKMTLQTFGKLPLYSDYLSFLTHKASNAWRQWLLEYFSRDGMRIPQGHWPFVFYPREGDELVVGLMEDSSDGIREFPFSLFVICPSQGQTGWFSWKMLNQVWGELSRIRDRLAQLGDVDACYGVLRAETLGIPRNGLRESGYLRLDHIQNRPLLLGAPDLNARSLHQLSEAHTAPMQILNNWNQLSRNAH